MSSSIYFKNQKRSSTAPFQKFIPEYVQRNVEPSQRGNISRDNITDAAQMVFSENDLFEDENKISEEDIFVPSHFLKDKEDSFDHDPTKEETFSIEQVIQSSSCEDYIVLIDGECLCSAPKLEAEKICNDLIFGKSLFFENVPVEHERITVIKKVSIKVGLFLE